MRSKAITSYTAI